MKKWTFLVATLLTVSAGSLMTSCIDNDEPAGIEAIRVATANLLEAKKAVLLAQAEATKAAAENDKLLAAADAAIKEAQAKVLEADAAIKNAQAAGEQAKADKLKAEAEYALAKAKADLDVLMATNAQLIAEAKTAEAKAVAELEQLQRENADKLDSDLYQAVVTAYQAYLGQLGAYNRANEKYLEAQKAYIESELDLTWNGSSFDSPNWDKEWDLKENVANAQDVVDGINNSTAQYEEAISRLEGIQAGELYTLLTEYKAKLKENTDSQAQVNIAKAELRYKNQALWDSIADTYDMIYGPDGLMNQEITIAPYEYPGNPAIPGFEDKFPIVGDNVTFTLQQIENNPTNNPYINAVNDYTYNIEAIKAQLSTPNGSAWTAAELAELERSQEQATKDYEKAQASWDLAQTIYNKGGVPDITSANMPQVAEIEAAVTALNTVGATLQTSKDAVVAAHTTYANAQKAFDAADKAYTTGDPDKQIAATNAKTTWQNALDAAQETYDDAVKENNKAADAAQDAVDQLAASQALSEKAAQNRVDAAQRQYDLATQTALANPTAANVAAQSAALTAWNNAITAQNKLVSDNATAMQKAQDAAQKAQENASLLNLAADNARLNAIDAANLAFMTAGGNIATGDYNQAADPAYQPVYEASQALEKAGKDYTAAVKAFTTLVTNATKKEVKNVTTNLNKQETTLGVAYTLTAWNKFTNETFPTYTTVPSGPNDTDANWKKFADDKYKDLTPAGLSPFMELNAATGEYTNAKAFVRQASNVLYGNTISVDRLEPLTVDEMNQYIAEHYSSLKPYQYYTMYGIFGAYGTMEYNKAYIAAIKATLNNADAINEAVAGLEAQLKALEDSKLAQEKLVDAAEAEYKALTAKKTALESALNHELANLQRTEGDFNMIIGAISSAILSINDLNGVASGTADEVINKTIEYFKGEITKNEKSLASAQNALDKAKYQLEQYQNGYTNIENPLKANAEAAKAELELQKTALEFLKARLDEAQAKYEANAKA